MTTDQSTPQPKAQTTAQAIPQSAAQPRVWTVYDGSRYLYVYENNNPNFGWDQTSRQWVPLTTAMQVWNPAGENWLPLMTDPAGNFQLP